MLKKPHQPIQVVNIDHLNLMESQLLGGYLQKCIFIEFTISIRFKYTKRL